MKKTINKENREFSKVGSIIKSLMIECNIIEAELARLTGLPQTTINRVLIGETVDPRAGTLIPIAKFFGITVGQLIGEEPLNPSRIPGSFNTSNRMAWSIIPIIDWKDVNTWLFSKNKYTPNNHHKWITTDGKTNPDAFALPTLDFMEPRFRKNSVIIVDPDFQYQDGNYVVISIANTKATVRRVMVDGPHIYLKKLYGNDKSNKLSAKDQILGTIIETRINEAN